MISNTAVLCFAQGYRQPAEYCIRKRLQCCRKVYKTFAAQRGALRRQHGARTAYLSVMALRGCARTDGGAAAAHAVLVQLPLAAVHSH